MTGSLPMADLLLVVRLLALLALASWIARPLADRLVPGGGWIVAALVAWCVMGWAPWMLAALRLVPFGTGALAGLGVLLALRLCLRPAATPWRGALPVVGGFVALFWLGLAQRLEQADLSGLEKFTNMAFLAATMRSDFMPPLDPWYAGGTINYYYVGQAMIGAWGLLIGATPDQTYQVAMATLFALTGLAVWHLSAMLARPAGPVGAQALGGLATLLTLYGGNFHAALYQGLRGFFPATNDAYYFADSTRFVGFDPDIADKGFTEFPAYSFAVGDLHAHVVALPVFFLGLTILMAVLSGRAAPSPWQAVGFGWVLGLCAMSNSWDVAILGLIALAVGLFVALAPPRATRWEDLGVASVLIAVSAFVTAAPFLGQFEPFASGIEAAPNHTPPWQLLVLYGHALLPAGLYAAILWRIPSARRHTAIGVLFLSAFILIVLPELVIVRDIYGLDFARANTMFKLTFRAQSLLVIASVATLGLALAAGRRARIGALVAAVPLLSILAFMPHIFAWPSTIERLDGLAFLGDERALVEAARHLPLAPGEALVEASGPAFGETARVSAMTGQPAVIGWAAHEWLWRNNGEHPNRRALLVETFYTTEDPAMRCAIIRRYSIRYAILGQVERRSYTALNVPGVEALGPVIHSSAGGRIIQIDPARCS